MWFYLAGDGFLFCCNLYYQTIYFLCLHRRINKTFVYLLTVLACILNQLIPNSFPNSIILIVSFLCLSCIHRFEKLVVTQALNAQVSSFAQKLLHMYRIFRSLCLLDHVKSAKCT